MNIFWHEIKSELRSALVWSCLLIVTAWIFIMLYPSFSHDVQTTRDMIKHFPPEVRKALGLSLDSFASFMGFYAYTFTYVTLAAAIQAIGIGVGIFSREERSKTTEFLLTKPAPRAQIFMAKYFAGIFLVLLSITTLSLGVFAISRLVNVGEYLLKEFTLLQGSLAILMVVFYTIGVLVSQLMRIKSVTPLALALGFGFFALGIVVHLVNDDILRALTPFAYFDYMEIIRSHSYEALYLFLALVIIVVCFALAFLRYVRRERKAVAS